MVTFLKENGFLFPVTANNYEEFDKHCLYSIINRLKMTVELMTAANEIHKDYQKIFSLTVSLLFSSDIHIKTNSMDSEYNSCHHTYADLVMNAPTTLSYERQQEDFDKDTYTVQDTIFGNYELDIQEYNDIAGGYSTSPGFNDLIFKNITALYLNYDGTYTERIITDFLFHYFHEIGIVNFNNGLSYYEEPKMENFNQAMKDGSYRYR